MKNAVLSVIAGLVFAWLIVSLAEAITHLYRPIPQDLDFNNKEAMETFIKSLPLAAFIELLLIWAISAFAGGWLSAKLSSSNKLKRGLITGGILLLGAVANLILIPHPIWFAIVSVLMYLPLAGMGAKLAIRTASNSV